MSIKKVSSKSDEKPKKNTKTSNTKDTPKIILEKKAPVAGKSSSSDKKNSSTTKITVKFDAGYSNDLYIRGTGADLKWEKGLKLVNVKADEWVWETSAKFTQCEFKILLNDRVYENGENRQVVEGDSLQHTPHFS